MLENIVQPFLHRAPSNRIVSDDIPGTSALTNMPGAMNILSFPFAAKENVQAIQKAQKIRDVETIVDASIRTLSLPFMALNGAGMSLNFMAEVHILHHSNTFTMATFLGSIAGIILSGLELIIEGLSFIQTSTFGKRLNKKLLEECVDTLSKPPEEQEEFLKRVGFDFLNNKNAYIKIFGEEVYNSFLFDIRTKMIDMFNGGDKKQVLQEFRALLLGISLSYIQSKYLQLSPEEQLKIEREIEEKFSHISPTEKMKLREERKENILFGKKTMLSRRISPWLVNKLEKEIIPILHDFTSNDETKVEQGITRSQSLIKDIYMQIEKKKCIHILGIICLIACITALSFVTSGAPIVLIGALYFIAFTMALSRYILYKGWLLNSNTWKIEWSQVPPEWSKKIYRYFSKKQDVSPPMSHKTIKLHKVSYSDRHEQWQQIPRTTQAYL